MFEAIQIVSPLTIPISSFARSATTYRNQFSGSISQSLHRSTSQARACESAFREILRIEASERFDRLERLHFALILSAPCLKFCPSWLHGAYFLINSLLWSL
jgi:hypothetical protein